MAADPEGQDRERQDNGGVFAPVALTRDRPPLIRWAAVAAILLIVVIAKPWAPAAGPEASAGGAADAADAAEAALEADASGVPGDGDLPGASGMVVAVSAPIPTSTVVPSPPASDAVADFCLDLEQWLIASVETSRGRTIRIWRAIDPAVSATGPDDATIPVTTIITEQLLELGWCAPQVGTERPVGSATVDAWSLGRTGPRPEPLTRVAPIDTGSPFGAMYGPRTARLDRPRNAAPLTSWPDGRYVFRYRTDVGVERWFAVDVISRPAVLPTP